MFRRLSSSARAVVAARFYTPPEGLKKLYASDFENSKYPLNIVPSDSVLFAKFLYKAAEEKGNFDNILSDFQKIAAAASKLPIFWERTAVVEKIPEFKQLSEPTFFTLVWMQNNGMLELIQEVAEVYETFVNAKQKKAVAKIFVAPGGEKNVEEARRVAEELHKGLKELADYTLVLKTVVDRTIVKGFAVELAGQYVNKAEGQQKQAGRADEVDYTNLPAPKPQKTVWDDNIETEVLRKYLDGLSQYDMEEAKYGV
ncbi:ATP synthase delta (OSCP) subunit, putative [Trypanosoma equiperdum]|uniref:Uncharacterized protein n=4 Tax=Trypanozoon TaxID=39700 RepID=Q38AG1_TRYB2|nr:hypothetical protein, conserved [Trypanosoma brucei gambiense DAL972]XP_823037.1 hypothetical protein, conserved [Trypanosoma brucei brucei TREU927]8AP6_M1 Chain M1, oligomycin sensitiviy conferring protein [Trypanosoma brucei brucei]8AP6_M2 Chain M2, oligomycin sensitiviy conferring protein [Trypanosoma brucei brucei]8AP8_M Chain M, OSCP [Trypanosoma brucei brucei]8APA_M1 Chain M1, OSCP [Trypanosoma brucei brucei]8APB_M1 Chain M1, oligomycin-sensivity-conferring protein [Trypanosoma bruce|eukprot:XP_011778155.1 hypothetical protein, conserved [Trypanosoma brucei gambiense DAL972]